MLVNVEPLLSAILKKNKKEYFCQTAARPAQLYGVTSKNITASQSTRGLDAHVYLQGNLQKDMLEEIVKESGLRQYREMHKTLQKAIWKKKKLCYN